MTIYLGVCRIPINLVYGGLRQENRVLGHTCKKIELDVVLLVLVSFWGMEVRTNCIVTNILARACLYTNFVAQILKLH